MSNFINIVQVTTVHKADDNRIFHKILLSLRNQNFKIYYIACENKNIDEKKYPEINFIKLKNGKFFQRLINMFVIFINVIKIKPGIIHFHDIELIPLCILMRLTGWKIIYDVHEDNKLSFRQKKYLPIYLRYFFSHLAVFIEVLAKKLFYIIIAEKIYKKRFPNSVMVLNYPVHNEKDNLNVRTNFKRINILYTGTVSEDRGALLFLDVLKNIPNAYLTVVGKCDERLKKIILKKTKLYSKRIKLHVSQQGCSFLDIKKYYLRGNWAYGLALFPKSDHYYEKQLTKFFEYMQYGIPILCSDFPSWKSLIKQNEVGICLDTDNLNKSFILNKKIISNQIYWSKLSLNSQKLSANFSWNTQFKNMLKLYKKIVKQ